MSKNFIPFPEQKYNVIYADPPWQFGSKAYQDSNRKMLVLDETQYKTMTINDIKNLPVSEITDKDCALFMWVTDSHLKEGIEVMEAWGFKYKTVAFNWIKKICKWRNMREFCPVDIKKS